MFLQAHFRLKLRHVLCLMACISLGFMSNACTTNPALLRAQKEREQAAAQSAPGTPPTASNPAAGEASVPEGIVTPTPAPKPADTAGPQAGRHLGQHDRDPLDLASHFVQDCLSQNGALAQSDALDPAASTFNRNLNFMQELTRERRQAMSNAKHITRFEIEDSAVSEQADAAFVYMKAREYFVYEDEPNDEAATRCKYVLLLRKAGGGNWRVAWANCSTALGKLIANPAYQDEGATRSDAARVQGFLLPFLPSDSEFDHLDELSLAGLDTTELFVRCEAYHYGDHDWIRENESRCIRADQESLMATVNPDAESSLTPLNREAMQAYLKQWVFDRNPDWPDFDPYGGDCQNFASQTLLAGGAEMCDGWYFHDFDDRVPSWSGVQSMRDFIVNNEGEGPHAIELNSWTGLKPGDLVDYDWNFDESGDHVTVVYKGGRQARYAGHNGDAFNVRISDGFGSKSYLHIRGISS